MVSHALMISVQRTSLYYPSIANQDNLTKIVDGNVKTYPLQEIRMLYLKYRPSTKIVPSKRNELVQVITAHLLSNQLTLNKGSCKVVAATIACGNG